VIPAGMRLEARRLELGVPPVVLGEGGFAQVIAATYDFGRRVGRRSVAFKKLNAGVVSTSVGVDLVRELNTQAAVVAHPHIVKVLGALADEATGFGLLLELATHGSLHALLHQTTKPLAWPERVQILVDVASGLAALHGALPREIVHSDLKSANVLLFDAGDGSLVAKLSDFGLAEFSKNSSSMRSKTGVGTVNWSAPEVFEDHYKPASTSDIWSLGMICFEVMARALPFAGLSFNQIMKKLLFSDDKLPDLALVESGAPAGLGPLLRRCCATAPALRPAAETVSRDLAAVLVALETPAGATPLSPGGASPRSTQHHGDMVLVLEALRALREGQGRIEASLEAHGAMVRRALTTVLALTNEEVAYPPLFLIVPTRTTSSKGGGGGGGSGRSGSGFGAWFETTNSFTVIFLCERTLTALPYGGSSGLAFTVLKEAYGKAACAASRLMKTCGPVIKLAAAATKTAVGLTTGLKLDALLPTGILDAAGEFATAEAFLSAYCASVSAADAAQADASPWASVEPAAGLEYIEARAVTLAPPARDAYFQFQRFLADHAYDRSKLLEHAAVVAGEDGRMHWERTSRPVGSAGLLPASPPLAPVKGPGASSPSSLPRGSVNPLLGDGAFSSELSSGWSTGASRGSSPRAATRDPSSTVLEGHFDKKKHFLPGWDLRYFKLYSDRLEFGCLDKGQRFLPRKGSPLPVSAALEFEGGKRGGLELRATFKDKGKVPASRTETFRFAASTARDDFFDALVALKTACRAEAPVPGQVSQSSLASGGAALAVPVLSPAPPLLAGESEVLQGLRAQFEESKRRKRYKLAGVLKVSIEVQVGLELAVQAKARDLAHAEEREDFAACAALQAELEALPRSASQECRAEDAARRERRAAVAAAVAEEVRTNPRYARKVDPVVAALPSEAMEYDAMCPNTVSGCRHVGKRSDMAKHMEFECKYKESGIPMAGFPVRKPATAATSGPAQAASKLPPKPTAVPPRRASAIGGGSNGEARSNFSNRSLTREEQRQLESMSMKGLVDLIKAAGIDPSDSADKKSALVALAGRAQQKLAASSADKTSNRSTGPKEDPRYERYFKMLAMGAPRAAVEARMKLDGLHDYSVLDTDGGAGSADKTSNRSTGPKEDPRYERYFKMLAMGAPRAAVEAKMKLDGHHDYSVLDTTDGGGAAVFT